MCVAMEATVESLPESGRHPEHHTISAPQSRIARLGIRSQTEIVELDVSIGAEIRDLNLRVVCGNNLAVKLRVTRMPIIEVQALSILQSLQIPNALEKAWIKVLGSVPLRSDLH